MTKRVIATLGALTLAACGFGAAPEPVDAGSLVGTWQGTCTDYPETPTVTLDSAKTFTAKRFPYETSGPAGVEILDGSGTWELWTDRSDSDQSVNLFFKPTSNQQLTVSRGKKTTLILHIGDPDNANSCNFTKS